MNVLFRAAVGSLFIRFVEFPSAVVLGPNLVPVSFDQVSLAVVVAIRVVMDASERRLFELGSADDDRRSRAEIYECN